MANIVWRSIRARCPYYLRSNDTTITCQGVLEGEEIRRRLKCREDCDEFFSRNCAMHYSRCKIYKLLEEHAGDAQQTTGNRQ